MAGFACALQENLGKAIECLHTVVTGIGVGRTLGVAIGRIAIAHAEDAHRTADGEGQLIASGGNHALLLVLHLHAEDGHVLPIGLDGGTIWREDDAGGCAGGLYFFRQDALAVLIAHGLHCAGLVDSLPGEVTVLGHGFAAQVLAVDRQLHFVAVAVHPDVDAVALMALQVPVGQDVEHRFVRPPGLQVIGLILGEAAIVQDAELRTRSRELHGIGLAAIVEARPIEQAGEVGTLVVELPAALNTVQQAVLPVGAAVVGHHAAGARLVEVDAARAAARSLFRTKGATLGIVLAVLLHGILQDVVVAGHVGRNQDGGTAAAGHGHQAGRVEAMAILAHGSGDAGAGLLPLDAPLFVAHAPEDDGGMIAVAADHALQEVDVLGVDTRQAVLFNDEDAEAVASVEHLRRHGVVGSAVGIAAELLELLEAVDLQRIGNAAAHTRMVLVHVGPLQLDVLPVEEEATVGVEGDVADAEGGLVAVHHLPALQHLGTHIIYIRCIHRPKARI